MATTPNFGWVTPAPTDFVTDLPADFETFADAVDADVQLIKNTADAALPETLIDAAGDLIYGSAADTAARLAIGTAGQVLKVNAGATAPEWGTISAGAFTELASGSLSGSAVNLTSISGSYKTLYLVLRNFKMAVDAGRLRWRVNNDTNNIYAQMTPPAGTSSSFDNLVSWLSEIDDTDDDNLAIIELYDYANTTTFKMGDQMAIHQDATTPANIRYNNRGVLIKTTSAISEINLIPLDNSSVSTTFAGGTYTLYGVN